VQHVVVLTTAAKEAESQIPELDKAGLIEPTKLAQPEASVEGKPSAEEENKKTGSDEPENAE